MSAVISACGRYRYRLERHGLSGSGAVAWIMVNPSVADATEDDPTIRRVIGFTERMGAGWAIVGNKFAYRATDVRDLRGRHMPVAVGPENDAHLERIMRDAPLGDRRLGAAGQAAERASMSLAHGRGARRSRRLHVALSRDCR